MALSLLLSDLSDPNGPAYHGKPRLAVPGRSASEEGPMQRTRRARQTHDPRSNMLHPRARPPCAALAHVDADLRCRRCHSEGCSEAANRTVAFSCCTLHGSCCTLHVARLDCRTESQHCSLRVSLGCRSSCTPSPRRVRKSQVCLFALFHSRQIDSAQCSGPTATAAARVRVASRVLHLACCISHGRRRELLVDEQGLRARV